VTRSLSFCGAQECPGGLQRGAICIRVRRLGEEISVEGPRAFAVAEEIIRKAVRLSGHHECGHSPMGGTRDLEPLAAEDHQKENAPAT
jgi:hypothetical protein